MLAPVTGMAQMARIVGLSFLMIGGAVGIIAVIDVPFQLVPRHGSGLDRAGVILAEPAEVLLRQRLDLLPGLFFAKAHGEIALSHFAMAAIDEVGERAARPTDSGDPAEWQRLEGLDQSQHHEIKKSVHRFSGNKSGGHNRGSPSHPSRS